MAEADAATSSGIDFGEEFDAVIIGAGIGGLVCGALMAKEGAKVLIVERHSRPGGFVTDYERNGFRFQVPHMVGGCGPDGPVTRVIEHLGIRQDFIRVEPFMRFVYPEYDIIVPYDLEEYGEVLKEHFQPQTTNINSFFKALRSMARGLDPKMLRRPIGASGVFKMLAYPFIAPQMLTAMMTGMTLQKLLDKHITDEQLKAVLATPWPFLGAPPWEVAALSMVGMVKSFTDGAYFPVGGFGAMADAFAKAFTDQGGTLLLEHEVTSVNTEGKSLTSPVHVTGVETVPRARVATGIVVSDADSKRTFIKLLDRSNFADAFLERVDEEPVSMTGLVVHLGLGKEAAEDLAGGPVFVQPSYDEREMLEELAVKDRYPDPAKMRYGLMAHSTLDPSLAPEGSMCLDIVVPAVPYNFMRRWGVEEGGVRGERYEGVKEKYAEAAVKAVSLAFPDLINNVQAYDVSTPVTYERYTMAIDGCWYDSRSTGAQGVGKRRGPRTPVKGLYLTGSKSSMGGGIYPSVLSGVITADSVTRASLLHLL